MIDGTWEFDIGLEQQALKLPGPIRERMVRSLGTINDPKNSPAIIFTWGGRINRLRVRRFSFPGGDL
jgi:hypothetical protein